jgi:hypothetical protein
VRPDDLFEDFARSEAGGRMLDVALLNELRRGPASNRDDLEIAVPLARLVHDELEGYGTSGGQETTNDEIKTAILALRATIDRLGIHDVTIPFRDFATFKSWWIKEGARGSWQARRDLLSGVFDHLHDRLADLEELALRSSLVEPISPKGRTGWPVVDTEISELRRHFLNARTAQDYRNVGLDCVSVTEALSRHVFNASRHLRYGEEEPPVSNTKLRLERFIEDAASGSANAALRRLARAAIEFAQQVKHSGTPSRREAGIAADAVIQLANMLKRLEQDG